MSDGRLPTRWARPRGTSNERPVRLPERSGVDRRTATRYPLTLGVRYVIQNRHGGVAMTGVGHTVDLSSCGVRFTTGSSLETGLRVKLFIDWPALLDGAVDLQLTMEGTVVRNSTNDLALRIERRGFR